jgi:hypothetical protein
MHQMKERERRKEKKERKKTHGIAETARPMQQCDSWVSHPRRCRNSETRDGAETARPTTVRTGEPTVGLVKPTANVSPNPLPWVGLDPFKNLLAPF